MDGYITITETAEHLACSKRTITRRIADGEIKGVKLNNRWFIDESSVDAFVYGMTWDEQQALSALREQNARDAETIESLGV